MTTATLQSRFNHLEDLLNADIVEHEEAVHGVVLALAAGEHVFLLGPPGGAKSLLADRMRARIDGARQFKTLLSPFATPEGQFGPWDLLALKEGHYRRLIDGYLASVELAFIDEIWNASDAILHDLHMVTNEREFVNDGVVISVPLSTMICASNVMPQNSTLAAIYDRILLRYSVPHITDGGNFVNMLRLEMTPATPVLSWDDVAEAKAAVAQVPFDDEVYAALVEVRRELRSKNIDVTDRRFKRSLRVLQAEAWLEGASQVDVDQIMILAHVLWELPEQITDVEAILSEKVSPGEKEALALLEDIGKIGDIITKAKATDDPERQSALGLEAYPKIVSAASTLKGLSQGENRVSRRQQRVVKKCSDDLARTSFVLLVDVLHYGFEEARKALNGMIPASVEAPTTP